mmetsp:Transcript_7667/g.10004  ORF Transcript_7667/g.10004 Transcript_7667/m.10004 type:complete len:134 (+) Transcript_7667:87-488(+)
MKFTGLLVLCIIGLAAAFQAPMQGAAVTSKFNSAVQPRSFNTASLKMAEDMSWEGDYPPSKVLGPVLSKMPSGILGPLSLVMFAAGGYCVHESNIFNILNAETVKPLYVLGSLLTPISWGTHVACWIQQKNGN